MKVKRKCNKWYSGDFGRISCEFPMFFFYFCYPEFLNLFRFSHLLLNNADHQISILSSSNFQIFWSPYHLSITKQTYDMSKIKNDMCIAMCTLGCTKLRKFCLKQNLSEITLWYIYIIYPHKNGSKKYYEIFYVLLVKITYLSLSF